MKESTAYLIVNADDLGMSMGVNRGVAQAHRRGIVTSASLMVRRPAAGAAAELLGGMPSPSLAIGLHLEIEEAAGRRGGEVEADCRDQLREFRRLLGRDPTHLDSHHHAHTREPVASAARELAAELGIHLRGCRVRYEGGFFARSSAGAPRPERISVEHLLRMIAGLPAGWTELGCHPGLGVGSESSYGQERERELESLCDARVVSALKGAGVELRSFVDVR